MNPSAPMVRLGGPCSPRPAPPRPAPPDSRIEVLPAWPARATPAPPAAASGLRRAPSPSPQPTPPSPTPRCQGLHALSVAAAGLHWTQWTLHSLSGPLSQGRLQRAQSEEKSRWEVGNVHISGPPCIILAPSTSASVLRFSPQLSRKKKKKRK